VDRPTEAEYAPFYGRYLALVPEDGLLGVLEGQPAWLRDRLAGVSAERERHRYAPGKWSVRQVVGHMGDVERVLGHRAFCISRGEAAPLPGFDENAYVARSSYADQPLTHLTDDFARAREANLAVFRQLDDEAWRRQGVANGSPVSVRALGFILAGHARHHVGVLESRYGIGGPR
jgi:hypothetical protein